MPSAEEGHLYRGRYRVASARLRGFDYASAGCFFVTICTHRHRPVLGAVVQDHVELSDAGEIVAEEWQRTPQVRALVSLGEWIVMPNHLHGVLIIHEQDSVRERRGPGLDTRSRLVAGSLGAIVGQIKSVCTKRIRAEADERFAWQARFYDHIIRSEEELDRVQGYIYRNPAQWAMDRYYVETAW